MLPDPSPSLRCHRCWILSFAQRSASVDSPAVARCSVLPSTGAHLLQQLPTSTVILVTPGWSPSAICDSHNLAQSCRSGFRRPCSQLQKHAAGCSCTVRVICSLSARSRGVGLLFEGDKSGGALNLMGTLELTVKGRREERKNSSRLVAETFGRSTTESCTFFTLA
jgi:hypothetical protein